MQHQNAGTFDHRFENTRVIAMIITHVVENRVERAEKFERIRIFLIITNLKTRNHFRICGLKAIDKKRDVRMRCQIRKQLFAVICDA